MNRKSARKLKNLREKIDEIDAKIINLLRKREEIVKNIGKTKQVLGIDVVDKKREEVVLKRAGKYREIFREIIRYSKSVQYEKRIGIIGYGKIGKLFAKEFLKFFEVGIYSKNLKEKEIGEKLKIFNSLEELFYWADIILIATPLESAKDILERLVSVSSSITGAKIIADTCTFKKELERIYLKFPKNVKVCSIHPMFGEGAKNIKERNILVVKISTRNIPKEIIDILKILGARVIKINSVEEHDNIIQTVVGIPYFLGISYLAFTNKIKNIEKFGGTSFKFFTTYGKALLNDSEEFITHVIYCSMPKIKEFVEFALKKKFEIRKLKAKYRNEVKKAYKKFYEI